MKLIRFGEAGAERPGVIINENRYDVSEYIKEYDEEFFGGDGIEGLKEWVSRNHDRLKPVSDDVRLGPPMARPSKLICIGLNYVDHAKETGATPPQELEPLVARHGRPMFQGTGMAMYNEQEPQRALRIFEASAAAQRRGNGLYVQIPCQPLSFDFTMANAYPFYSHAAFDPIKAYSPAQLAAVFRDPSWRAQFRDNLSHPRPGMIFQGNWDRVMVAVTHQPAHARYVNRQVAEIAASEGRDPLDVVLDMSLDEDLQTAFLGRFLNVGDDGVAKLLKHEAGVVALSDAGAHLIYMCDAGFGLHFLAHWVRARGDFDLVEGVRRLTSHPADLYGIADRGRIAVGAHADLMLFDPQAVGVTPAERVADLPGGGRRTIRRPTGVHGVFCNGIRTFDGRDYVRHAKGPGAVLDRFTTSRGRHLAPAAS